MYKHSRPGSRSDFPSDSPPGSRSDSSADSPPGSRSDTPPDSPPDSRSGPPADSRSDTPITGMEYVPQSSSPSLISSMSESSSAIWKKLNCGEHTNTPSSIFTKHHSGTLPEKTRGRTSFVLRFAFWLSTIKFIGYDSSEGTALRIAEVLGILLGRFFRRSLAAASTFAFLCKRQYCKAELWLIIISMTVV